MLGEFEYLILTVAATLAEDAYGAAIGALYTTIERLESKGLLKTWMGDATPQRGGRAKRMVRVTPKGTHAAKEFYEAITKISIDAAWASLRPGAKA
jgi:DNA-binding PadR family transcriptional regulator